VRTAGHAAARLEAIANARDMIERLPRREAETLILVAWGELSYQETVDVLGVPIGTVRSRLVRARGRVASVNSNSLSFA
jgi:RNA polymerase sigma-70 factor (ECF subfamily)